MPRTRPPKMPTDKPPKRADQFYLEIHSIEEFAAFIALIRGVDLDHLSSLTAQLKTGRTALAAQLPPAD